MKKICVVITLLLTFSLYGCTLTTYQKAKKSFEDGDFETTITLLEGSTSEKSKTLYDNAKEKIYENELTKAISDRDTELTVQKITDFEGSFDNDSNIEELESLVMQQYTDILDAAPTYTDFKYIEDVKTQIETAVPDTSLVKNIDELLSAHAKDKQRSALTGVWTRTDNTNLNGAQIEVMFSDDSGKAILIATAPNDNYFKNGDVKWQNIEFFSDTNFSYEDLVRYNTGETSYDPANATIDYSNMTISVHVSGSGTGTEQVWTKANN